MCSVDLVYRMGFGIPNGVENIVQRIFILYDIFYNMNTKAILNILEAELKVHSETLEITICGGAAIQLLGYSNRPTKDIDVIVPTIPDRLQPLIKSIAYTHQLADDWLNNGPASLIHDLEIGWKDRTTLLYRGPHLTIRVLSRHDLIFSKLYAMCDRREDIRDLLAMQVTDGELQIAGLQVKNKDDNPNWPKWVDICIAEIIEERGTNESS